MGQTQTDECFACLNVCLSNNDAKKNINDSSNQLEAIFLLRRFLEIPEDMYRKVHNLENPVLWLHFCNTCLALVGKAKQMFDEVEALKIKFTELQIEFKNKILLSTDSQLKRSGQPEAKEQIRTYVCEELKTVKGEFPDSDSEPMNDNESGTSLTQEVDEDFPSTINEVEGEPGESQPSNVERTDNFLCGVCKKQFVSDLEQKNHLCDSTKLKVFLETLDINSRKYSCHLCKASFKLIVHLEKHIESHANPEKGVNSKFVCDICNKSFERVRYLERHLRTHAKLPIVRDCSFCGKTFKTSKDLKEHIRTHTGEKPYKCDICGNRFKRSSQFARHRSTHRNEKAKSFNCSICDQKFLSSDLLIKHNERLHKSSRDTRSKNKIL